MKLGGDGGFIRCEAISDGGVPCHREAVIVGKRGDVQAYLCSDDANRAMAHGWTIGPTVSDMEAFIAGHPAED